MIKLKELLRLKYEAQLSLRQIALCLSLSVGVISKYLPIEKSCWARKRLHIPQCPAYTVSLH